MKFFRKLFDGDDPQANSKIFISVVSLFLVIIVVIVKLIRSVVQDFLVWALVALVLGGAGISTISGFNKK
jgi:hypothetical protein